jgi:hypothetical protein
MPREETRLGERLAVLLRRIEHHLDHSLNVAVGMR